MKRIRITLDVTVKDEAMAEHLEYAVRTYVQTQGRVVFHLVNQPLADTPDVTTRREEISLPASTSVDPDERKGKASA